MKRVVVTGMGGLAPNGNSVREMWDALCNGRSGIGRVTAFDASPYPSRIGGEVKGFDPRRWMDAMEVRRMDRFAQFAVSAASPPNAGCPRSPRGAVHKGRGARGMAASGMHMVQSNQRREAWGT